MCIYMNVCIHTCIYLYLYIYYCMMFFCDGLVGKHKDPSFVLVDSPHSTSNVSRIPTWSQTDPKLGSWGHRCPYRWPRTKRHLKIVVFHMFSECTFSPGRSMPHGFPSRPSRWVCGPPAQVDSGCAMSKHVGVLEVLGKGRGEVLGKGCGKLLQDVFCGTMTNHW